jgi:hypothetical protein
MHSCYIAYAAYVGSSHLDNFLPYGLGDSTNHVDKAGKDEDIWCASAGVTNA